MTGDAVMLSSTDLLRVRMRGLGLTRTIAGVTAGSSGADRVTAVVDHLFALQGQDWRASHWAIGARAPATTAADITAACNECQIVRSWPMRGTVHLTRAEDIGWIQRLTGRRVIAGAARRRDFLGITDQALERLVDTTLEALSGGRSLDRDELSAVWSDAGLEWKSNWRYHLIWWMCQNGLTTFGPVSAPSAGTWLPPEPRLVRASEWIRHPRDLNGDEALVELASRYVRGRGAVRQKDLAWWSMLTARDTKRALELAAEAGRIVRHQLADVSGAQGVVWVDPVALDTHASDESDVDTLLLPSFDEHLLGFQNREAQLDPLHFDLVVPGKNGVFLPTVVRGGRTVATWRLVSAPSRAANAEPGEISVTPLPGATITSSNLTPAIMRWAEFHGAPPPTVRF